MIRHWYSIGARAYLLGHVQPLTYGLRVALLEQGYNFNPAHDFDAIKGWIASTESVKGLHFDGNALKAQSMVFPANVESSIGSLAVYSISSSGPILLWHDAGVSGFPLPPSYYPIELSFALNEVLKWPIM